MVVNIIPTIGENSFLSVGPHTPRNPTVSSFGEISTCQGKGKAVAVPFPPFDFSLLHYGCDVASKPAHECGNGEPLLTPSASTTRERQLSLLVEQPFARAAHYATCRPRAPFCSEETLRGKSRTGTRQPSQEPVQPQSCGGQAAATG